MSDVILLGLVHTGQAGRVDRRPYRLPMDDKAQPLLKMLKVSAERLNCAVIVGTEPDALPSARLKAIMFAMEGDVSYEDFFTVITDADLDAWATGAHRGYANSVKWLRPLNPVQREFARREAHTRMNMCAGWNFSGAAWQAAQDVAEGSTPYLDSAHVLCLLERQDKLREA